MEDRNIITAKSAGFCFGVRRAVEMACKQAQSGQTASTYGPIIHNEQVVSDLAAKGVHAISEQELDTLEPQTVIIRSHGAAPHVYETLKKCGCQIVDATCPFVKKIHRIVEKASKEGSYVVIIGDASHPEVEGIVGWCDKERVSVVSNREQAEEFTLKTDAPLCIVAQTTLNNKKFKDLVDIFAKKSYDINVVNTICDATARRQAEAEEIAASVDVMVVIGGRSSSNTKKLYEVCKSVCNNTFYIQTSLDLHNTRLGNIQSVGITAGASTPDYIIKEVQNYVRNEF
jgi:4-hydroxy-3-methylbut-2-enyl diphosphate reductase